MAAEPFPDWPSEGNRFIDSAHLHALGQLTLTYNLLEDSFGYLFARYHPTSWEFAVTQYFELNNRKRVDLLRELVKTNEIDETVKRAVLAAIHGYDVCTNNRNILSHSMVESTEPGEILRLSKRKARSSKQFISYEVPLSNLRRAADDTGAYFVFLVSLENFFSDRDALARGETMDSRPRALPEIPPPPQKLIQSQAAKADTSG